jgi:hypothetical protein
VFRQSGQRFAGKNMRQIVQNRLWGADVAHAAHLGGLISGAAPFWLMRPRTVELFACIEQPGEEARRPPADQGPFSGEAWPGLDPGWTPVRRRKCDPILSLLHCSTLTRRQAGHSLPSRRSFCA